MSYYDTGIDEANRGKKNSNSAMAVCLKKSKEDFIRAEIFVILVSAC